MVSIIAALAENGAIGNRGELIYRIPADLKRFKMLTTGNTVVMGRKTFQSLPKGALPNRRNIVLTRNPEITFEGAECYGSFQEALENCDRDEKIYIIGGAEIYRQTLPFADELEITFIHDTPHEADTFFPAINYEEWEKTDEKPHTALTSDELSYTFTTFRRKVQ